MEGVYEEGKGWVWGHGQGLEEGWGRRFVVPLEEHKVRGLVAVGEKGEGTEIVGLNM